MRKVYIVTEGGRGDFYMHGVFSSKKAADNFVKALNESRRYCEHGSFYGAEVEAWTLNTANTNLYYSFLMDRSGDTRGYRVDIEAAREFMEFNPDGTLNGVRFSIQAKSLKHALKIANERRARMIAEETPDVLSERIVEMEKTKRSRINGT